MDPKVVIYAKKHISLIPKNAYLKVERKEGKKCNALCRLFDIHDILQHYTV